jgi:hypothetical protein
LIVRVVAHLTRYYRAPQRFESWATLISRRDGYTESEERSAVLRDWAGRIVAEPGGNGVVGIPRAVIARWAAGEETPASGLTATGSAGPAVLSWGRLWWAPWLPLANERIDWWLFLFPDGADWGRTDGGPVHALLTFAAGMECFLWDCVYGAYGLMGHVAEQIGRDGAPDWCQLARWDAAAAARYLNGCVVRCLEAEPDGLLLSAPDGAASRSPRA